MLLRWAFLIFFHYLPLLIERPCCRNNIFFVLFDSIGTTLETENKLASPRDMRAASTAGVGRRRATVLEALLSACYARTLTTARLYCFICGFSSKKETTHGLFRAMLLPISKYENPWFWSVITFLSSRTSSFLFPVLSKFVWATANLFDVTYHSSYHHAR